MKNVVEFAEEILGIQLYPLQAIALEGISTHVLSVLPCGRRGGKSLLTAIWAVYDACIRDLRHYQRDGEIRYVLVVAGSFEHAKTLFRTIHGMFDNPMLAPMVLGEATQDEIKLVNNVILKVVPCSDRTTTGLPASTVIFEEMASYIDTDGHQSGDNVYTALEPSTIQVKDDGRIIAPSTPRGQRGVFYGLYQEALLREDAYVLHCPTWELNLEMDRDELVKRYKYKPDLFAQECEASFTAIGGSFMDSTTILEATRPIPEHNHLNRVLALDPAFSQDDFGIAIACVPIEDESQVYLEHVEALHHPSFNYAMDYASKLAKQWNVNKVVVDQMSQQAIVEELKKRGVPCQKVPWTAQSKKGKSKSDRFVRVRTLLNQGRIILIDSPELRQEFIEITKKPTATGSGIAIQTYAPDDMVDASVMAITEALTVKTKAPVVHEYGVMQMVIPEHQSLFVKAFFPDGMEIDASYIDR